MEQHGYGQLRMGGAALIVAVLIGRLTLDSSQGARVMRETGPLILVLFFATAVVAAFAAVGLPRGEPGAQRAHRRLRLRDVASATGRVKRHQEAEPGRIFLN